MRVNADSEWERRRGWEERQSGVGSLVRWRREIAALMGVRCLSVGFGGVPRRLKQTQTEERADIRATGEREG